MIVSWDKHLKNGNVWKVQVELAMQDTPGEEPYCYLVEVHVVAPTQALAIHCCYNVSRPRNTLY